MAAVIDRNKCESRVEESTHRILDLLDEHDTKTTFFILGWVADCYPDLVRGIDCRDHEIVSHGYNHRILYEQEPKEVRADVEQSLEVLEPLTDQPIRGYLAPSFSITEWATELLLEAGFEYDSSSFSFAKHDLYGDSRMIDEETADETLVGLSNGSGRRGRFPMVAGEGTAVGPQAVNCY